MADSNDSEYTMHCTPQRKGAKKGPIKNDQIWEAVITKRFRILF